MDMDGWIDVCSFYNRLKKKKRMSWVWNNFLFLCDAATVHQLNLNTVSVMALKWFARHTVHFIFSLSSKGRLHLHFSMLGHSQFLDKTSNGRNTYLRIVRLLIPEELAIASQEQCI